MSMFNPAVKARHWSSTMYIENMIDDWQDVVDEKLQLPFAYAIHDQDVDKKGEKRKPHVHFILICPNTTTANAALSVLKRLEKEGCSAFASGDPIEPVINIRRCYDYLIHDTEDSRKKKKFQYDKSVRVTGNGFDIGLYEQVSSAEKAEMRRTLAKMVCDRNIMNYSDFYKIVVTEYDSVYEEVVATYSAFFERLTRGNYQKFAPIAISNYSVK